MLCVANGCQSTWLQHSHREQEVRLQQMFSKRTIVAHILPLHAKVQPSWQRCCSTRCSATCLLIPLSCNSAENSSRCGGGYRRRPTSRFATSWRRCCSTQRAVCPPIRRPAPRTCCCSATPCSPTVRRSTIKYIRADCGRLAIEVFYGSACSRRGLIIKSYHRYRRPIGKYDGQLCKGAALAKNATVHFVFDGNFCQRK